MKKNTPKKIRVRKKRTPEEVAERRLLDAAVAFLKRRGWKLAVIGGLNIVQRLDSGKYRYTFGIHFTGSNPKLEAARLSAYVEAALTPGPETDAHIPAE